jgi:membrane associated rhomboid family serine protease
MVRNLLLLNVLFFLPSLLGFDLVELLGLRYLRSEEFQPYQFLTHMFMHSGFWHLFSNMLALYMFGSMLEQHWGAARFLVFYLVCGLGASLIYSAIHFYELYNLEMAVQSFIHQPEPMSFAKLIRNATNHDQFEHFRSFIIAFKDNAADPLMINQSREIASALFESRADVPMVGASGAVFGILMAFGMLYPNLEMMLLFFPIPIKAKYFVLLYGAYELYSGINRTPGDNVAHFAHLGGMLFAFILIKLWDQGRPRPNDYY